MQSRTKITGLEWVGARAGDLIRFVEAANGDIIGQLLPIPIDWESQEDDGTPYVLGIVDGLPEWRTVTAEVVATGFGYSYGNDYGGPA